MLRSGPGGKLPPEGTEMATEVLYQDGSTSSFTEGGGSFHEGDLSIHRLRLITAKAALETYLRFGGAIQLTANGHRMAVLNVIEPLSGKQFATKSGRVTQKSCREALEWCEAAIAHIEQSAVVLTGDEN